MRVSRRGAPAPATAPATNPGSARPGLPGLTAIRRLREQGFTLVAVVIGMLLLAILIATVGPALGKIGQRDREFELLFRGRQYARAIVLFQRRYGRLPTKLKEMYENNPRTIRQLWKDPMCNCDDWQLLIQGTPDANPQAGPLPSGTPGPQGSGPPPTPTPSPFGQPQNVTGPIIGVRSKVHKESITRWRNQKYYDEWRFIAGDADRDNANTTFDPTTMRISPNPSTR